MIEPSPPDAAKGRYPLSARHPLRVTLVVLIVGLMSAAVLVVGVVSTAVLNTYLYDRVNQQLTQSIQGPRIGMDVPARPTGPGFGAFSDDLYTQISNSDGQVLQSGGQTDDPPIVDVDPNTLGTPYSTSSESGSQWQIISVEIRQGQFLTIGRATSDIASTVSSLIFIELAVGGIAIVLAALAGYFVVRQSLDPLNKVAQAAGQIAQGDLTRRVPDLPQRTEVGSLAESLNIMLTQIERSFYERELSERQAKESEERMRRFVADASHELRTPLTSILGYAELNQSRDSVSLEESGQSDLETITSEATRMRVIVEDLLLLAKLDQERPQFLIATDLNDVATDAVQAIEVQSPGRVLNLELSTSHHPPIVNGDSQDLRRALLNILQNAVAYTPASTPIDVKISVNQTSKQAIMEVRDFGPGIDDVEHTRVFERFYRGEKSRSRQTGGMGLGLSIVQSIVESHRGTVTARSGGHSEIASPSNVDSTLAGRGTVFRIEIPLQETPS